MKKIRLISFVVVSLLVFGILVFASGQKDGEVKIKSIKIEGNNYLSSSEVSDIIKNDVINFSKDSIDIIKVKDKIQKNQYIKSSNLVFDDENLIVRIQERAPIAYYIQNDETKFISNDFKIMDYRKIPAHLDLPILHLSNFKKLSQLNNLNKLFDFFHNENVSFLKSHISEIFYNTSSSEVEFILTENAIKVKLGYYKNWEKNVRKLEDYWLTISLNERNNISLIDLRWDKRIVVS